MAPLSKTRVPLNRCEQSTHFYSASWWMVLDVAVPVLHSTVPFTERFQTPSNAITYIFNRIIWDWIDCFFFFNSARRNATLLVWIHLIKRSAFPFLIFINGAVHHVTSSETFLLAAEIVTNGHWMAPMQITVVAQSSFMSLSPDRVSNHLAPPPIPIPPPSIPRVLIGWLHLNETPSLPHRQF